MPAEIKNTNTKSTSNKLRCNDVSQNGKSIIEEWKNPPKYRENILRSDELYEERAIDVAVDYHRRQSHSNNVNTDIGSKGENTRNPSQNNGTVRSIPIKNYKASIVQNIGTLRRSEAPQLQFESSVSEPEKNFYLSKHKVASTNDVSLPQEESKRSTEIPRTIQISRYSEIVKPSRKSCHSCEYQREIQDTIHQDKPKLQTIDRRITKSEQGISMRDETEGFSDIDDYFRKSRRSTSNHRRSTDMKRKNEHFDGTVETTRTKQSKNEGRIVKKERKWATINIERGHVGQKISAYEENARRSDYDWDTKCPVTSERRRHRTIGVPLVGMHNACGLPIVSSWHDHEMFEPLRIRTKFLGTLRPIFRAPVDSTEVHRRTHPKRKAPQPQQRNSKKHRSIASRKSEKKLRKATIKSLIPLEGKDDEVTRTKNRRPSFKTTKIGTLSSKNSIKRAGRFESRRNKENSLAGSVGKKSLNAGSTKRRTLYARDDGEDAVQVLKNLCLNPLARTKSETDMMW